MLLPYRLDEMAKGLAPDNKAMYCCVDKVCALPVCTFEQQQQQVCGCMRQAFDEVAARTSTLPFQAIWEGRQVPILLERTLSFLWPRSSWHVCDRSLQFEHSGR